MELQLQFDIAEPPADDIDILPADDIDIIESEDEIVTPDPPKTPTLRPSPPPTRPISSLQLPAPWYEPFPGYIVGGSLAVAFVMELAANVFS
jgi:hypothetical protein